MSLSSEEVNKLYVAAALGKTIESTKLTSKEHKLFFKKILKELEAAPKGVMAAPINDWVGDEYDDVIAMIERVQQREIAKSIGTYELSKAEGDKRYTLGAMYIPDRLDAHGEWTDSEELQRAVWDYVRTNDRRIRLQHNKDVVAGEWVEVMAFPYELTVPIISADGQQDVHTYPANTVFLGVIWEPWAWDMIQAGKILGYSIGGKAERLYVDMEVAKEEATATSDGPLASDVHVDTLMNQQNKRKKIPAVEKPVEKEKPLDVEALTKTIIESLKKEMPAPAPAPAPVIVEKAPAIDVEAMMVRLAEIFAANQPVINVTLPEEKAKNRTIERDEFGNISRIIEED